MAAPLQLVFQECGFHAGDLVQFKDFNTGDKVAPVDVKKHAEKTLMEANVAPVGQPYVGAIESGGENHRSVDKDLGFALQVLVTPHSFVQSTKGTACFGKPVVHFFVYSGV